MLHRATHHPASPARLCTAGSQRGGPRIRAQRLPLDPQPHHQQAVGVPVPLRPDGNRTFPARAHAASCHLPIWTANRRGQRCPRRALLSGRPTLAWPAMERAAPCVLADLVALGTIVTGSRGRIRRASSDDAGPSTRADDRLDAAALCFQSCPRVRWPSVRIDTPTEACARFVRQAVAFVWRRIVIAEIGAAVLMSSLSSQLVGVNPWPPFTCATVPVLSVPLAVPAWLPGSSHLHSNVRIVIVPVEAEASGASSRRFGVVVARSGRTRYGVGHRPSAPAFVPGFRRPEHRFTAFHRRRYIRLEGDGQLLRRRSSAPVMSAGLGSSKNPRPPDRSGRRRRPTGCRPDEETAPFRRDYGSARPGSSCSSVPDGGDPADRAGAHRPPLASPHHIEPADGDGGDGVHVKEVAARHRVRAAYAGAGGT